MVTPALSPSAGLCALLCWLLLLPPALAQQAPRPAPVAGTVPTATASANTAAAIGNSITVVTDALEGGTPASFAITELARALAGDGGTRALAIAGRTSTENIHDLLYLRGIDLAVVNSDVFALLDLAQQLPDARRRVRSVAPMFDQKIFLLAKQPYRRLEDLRGKAVAALGPDARGYSTARAIFGLEKIEVQLQRLAGTEPLDATTLAPYDALLLVGEEITRFKPLGTGLSLIPITLTPALAAAYKASSISADEMRDLTADQAVPTIAVTTLLATFNWTSAHARYPIIRNFLTNYYKVLPKLHSEEGSRWRQTNISAPVPGFTPHALAKLSLYLSDDKIEALSKAVSWKLGPMAIPAYEVPPASASLSPPLPPQEAVRATKPETENPRGRPTGTPGHLLKVTMVQRQPLADINAREGGLLPKLLEIALNRATIEGSPRLGLAINWVDNADASLSLAKPSVASDVSGPWIGVDCDRPNNLSASASQVCDAALMSDPVMQVAFALYVAADSANDMDTPALREGRKICLAQDSDPSLLASGGRSWLDGKSVTIMRRPGLIDCLVAVDAHEVDGLVAVDFEATAMIRKLGLASRFRQTPQQLGTRGVQIAITRSTPGAEDLVRRINAGLGALKATQQYSDIITAHLQGLWKGAAAQAP